MVKPKDPLIDSIVYVELSTVNWADFDNWAIALAIAEGDYDSINTLDDLILREMELGIPWSEFHF